MENKVLAVVDGRDITEYDLYDLLQNIGQNASHFQNEEGQKQLVNELVMQELLYSEALAHHLNDEPDIIPLRLLTVSRLWSFLKKTTLLWWFWI